MQADCICIVYLCVPVCVIEGGGASSTPGLESAPWLKKKIDCEIKDITVPFNSVQAWTQLESAPGFQNLIVKEKKDIQCLSTRNLIFSL